ncbi:MAG: hypothetical protein DRP13_00910 [Candidatus Aenigmatarchaeota archaeon]|nr:MAG: hypothetical protein DRP18_00925 [Candidatus Aenigmarchaeota archaeon]RLJ09161.1 MAG: hypothetical protein DRP13_00910 [Candidatus Aenigmarchaeota archaeon]
MEKNSYPEGFYIETEIDKLFSLVKKKGIVGFSEAAKKFSVSENEVEEWAKILEEHKLVKLHYPIGKEPEIIYSETAKNMKSKKKRKGKPSKITGFVVSGMSVAILCIYLAYVYTVDNLRNYNIRAVINEKASVFTNYISRLPYPLNRPVVFILTILIIIIGCVLVIKTIGKKRKKKR